MQHRSVEQRLSSNIDQYIHHASFCSFSPIPKVRVPLRLRILYPQRFIPASDSEAHPAAV